jgi:hypothetical protein
MTRTRLLLGTALAAALIVAPAAAQLPLVTDVDVTLGGALPQTVDVGETLRIVTLNAARTYFDHGQGFFLDSTATLRFNFENVGNGGVALLRSDSGFSIFGSVQGRLGPEGTDPVGGNLWFFTRGGILLGEGASISGGGILLSSSLPGAIQSVESRQQLLNDGALLIESQVPPFEGSFIDLSGGASLQASSGFLALIADDISLPGGTTVNAAGTALFAAARGYRLQLARTASNDFDMVEFVIPAASASQTEVLAPIDIGATVVAGRIHLAHVTAGSLSTAVIRAPGTLVATLAADDGGGIVLSADGGIVNNAPGPASNGSTASTRFEAGTLISAGDIQIARTASASIESLSAARDVILREEGAVPEPGGVHAFTSIDAGRDIDLAAARLLVGPLTAGGSVRLLGDTFVDAGDILAGGDVSLIADNVFVLAPTGIRSSGPDTTLDIEARSGFLVLESRVEGFFDSRLAGFSGYDIRLFGDASIGRIESAAASFSTRVEAEDGSLDIRRLQGLNVVASASGDLRVLDLEADGFALLRSETGRVALNGTTSIRETPGNSGSLALDGATGVDISGTIDAAGDVYLVVRAGAVITDAAISAGDDLFMVAGGGGTVSLSSSASVTLTGLGTDGNGNLVTDPEFGTFLLIPEFGFDFQDNGRRLELLALDQFGQGPPGIGGSIFARGGFNGATAIFLNAQSGDVDFDADSLEGRPFISALADGDISVAGPDFEIAFTAGRDVRILAREAGLTLVESAAGRDLTLIAAGDLRLETVAAGRDVTLESGDRVEVVSLFGSLRDIRVTSGPLGQLLPNLSAAGTITLESLLGPIAAGVLTAGESLVVSGGPETRLPAASAGEDILIVGDRVVVDALAAGRDLLVETGELAPFSSPPSSFSAGQDLSLLVQGPIGPASVTAGRDVTLAATSAQFETIGGTPRNVTVTGLGESGIDQILIQELQASGTFAASGSSDLLFRLITTGEDILIDGPVVALETGEAGRDIRIEADQLVEFTDAPGGLTAGRDIFVDIRSGSLELRFAVAGDDIALLASSRIDADELRTTGLGPDDEGDGSNIFLDGETISNREVSAADDLTAVARDGLAELGTDSGLAVGRDLSITASFIDLGEIIGPVRNVTLSTLIGQVSGEITTGSISATGTIQATALGGGNIFGPLQADGDIDLDVGAVTFRGPLTAGGNIAIRTPGVLVDGQFGAASLTALGNIDVLAYGTGQDGDIDFASATAGGGISMSGLELVRVDFTDVQGEGALLALRGGTVETLNMQSAGSILVDASSGPALLGLDGGVVAAEDVEVRAFGLQILGLEAGRDLLLESRGPEGDILGDGYQAVRSLTLIAGRDIDVSVAEAGDDVTLEAIRSIASFSVSAGGDARVTGGSVTLGSQSEGGIFAVGSALVQALVGDAAIVFGEAAVAFRVEAAGSAAMQDVRVSNGSLTVEANADILAGRLEASEDILLDAGSLVAAGAGGGVVAGRDLVARGSGLALFGAGVGRNLELETRVADLRIDGDLDISGTVTLISAAGIAGSGSLAAQEDIDARAVGDILLDGTVATDASARFEAGGTVSLAGLQTGLDAEVTALSLALGAGADIGRDLLITATGAGFSATTALTAGRDIQVSGAGAIQLAAVEAGRDVVLTTPGALAAASVTAPGALAMSGASIALGGGTIGGSADLAAGSGPLAVSGLLVVGGNARLSAPDSPSGIISITRLETGGTATLAGFSVQGGTVVAGGSASVTGTGGATIDLDEVISDDDVDLESPVIRVGLVRSTGLGPDADGDGFNIRLTGGLGTFGTLDAPTDIIARFTGDLEIAIAAVAGQDIDLEGAFVGNRQSGPEIAAGRDARIVATADDVVARIRAGDDILVEAAGAAQLAQLIASGAGPDDEGDGSNIRVTAASVSSFSMEAQDDIIVLASSGPASLGSDGGVAAGRDLIVTGTSLDLVDASAGRDLLLEATAGDIVGPVFAAVRDLSLSASGRVEAQQATAGRDVALAAGTQVEVDTVEAARDVTLSGTDVFAQRVEAGRDAILGAGAGTLGLGTVEVGGIATLVGAELALRDTLSAAELRLVATGPMRFGGAPGGSGFVFSADDLARVTAPGGISASSGAVPLAQTPEGPASAAFAAGYGVGGTSDLVVDSFDFDPAAISLFGFYAGAAASIRVIGDITPSEAGGRIILGANPVDGLTPGAVLISGSLGAGELFLQDCYVALFPLENIAITALGDVIFGNAAFQSAVAAADPSAIDVQAGTPGLPPSPADDRLWAVTETLSITAPGRIVSQNTSSVPGSYAGLVIANRQSGALVPTVLTVRGGSVVDLTGVLVNGEGQAFFGPTAARSGAILASNPDARFNSCAVTGGGSCLPPLADPGLGFRPEQFLPPDPVPPEPFRLTGEILFVLGDTAGVSVLVEDGALFIRRDEEEERPERRPARR